MHLVSPTWGIHPMRASTPSSDPRRGTPRRLSRHVLAPLVAVGIVALAGGSAAVTLTQRDAAIHTIDARATAIRDVAEASLNHAGKLPGSHVGDVKLRLVSADRPLPGGRAVVSQGTSRTYTFTVGSRGDKRRLRFSLPAASVG